MSHYKQIRRSIAAFFSIFFFVSNGVLLHAYESNLWEDRKKDIQLARLPLSVPPQSVVSTPINPLKNIQLPNTNQKTVIHIQDIHLNQEAQHFIHQTIQALIQQKKIDLVGLEGAFEELDLKRIREFPHKETIRKVANYLLREGKISGAVYTAYTSPVDIPTFVGVDDPKHYKANVAAYVESQKIKDAQAQHLQARLKNLKFAKKEKFNPKLWVFDSKVQDYRTGNTSLGDYLQFLDQARKYDQAYLEISIFLEAMALEKSLDFHRVEIQRTRLLNDLLKNLNSNQMEALMQQSIAFRLGSQNHFEFYSFLEDLCQTHNIRLNRYPSVQDYFQYIKLSDQINLDKLFSEMKSLEAATYTALIQSQEEKALVDEGWYYHLVGKLLDFSLTPEEWREYKETAASFPKASVGNPRSHRSPTETFGDDRLNSFETFYTEAKHRDKVMTENLLNAMGESGANVAVLVSGGFHSKGIKALLKEKNINTLTISPEVSKIEDESGTNYLSVFTKEKTPLDKIFEGRKFFVSFPVTVKQGREVFLIEPVFRQLTSRLRLKERIFQVRQVVSRVIFDSSDEIKIATIGLAGGVGAVTLGLALSYFTQISTVTVFNYTGMALGFVGVDILASDQTRLIERRKASLKKKRAATRRRVQVPNTNAAQTWVSEKLFGWMSPPSQAYATSLTEFLLFFGGPFVLWANYVVVGLPLNEQVSWSIAFGLMLFLIFPFAHPKEQGRKPKYPISGSNAMFYSVAMILLFYTDLMSTGIIFIFYGIIVHAQHDLTAFINAAKPPIKILVADDEEHNGATYEEIQEVVETLTVPVELIKDHGKGEDVNWLLDVIQRERPDIILVRDSPAFQDPNFLAITKGYGVKIIIKAGILFDNIDIDYADRLGTIVIGAHGKSYTLKSLQTLVESLFKKSWIEIILFPFRKDKYEPNIKGDPDKFKKFGKTLKEDIERASAAQIEISEKWASLTHAARNESLPLSERFFLQNTVPRLFGWYFPISHLVDAGLPLPDGVMEEGYGLVKEITDGLAVFAGLPHDDLDQLKTWAEENKSTDNKLVKAIVRHIRRTGKFSPLVIKGLGEITDELQFATPFTFLRMSYLSASADLIDVLSKIFKLGPAQTRVSKKLFGWMWPFPQAVLSWITEFLVFGIWFGGLNLYMLLGGSGQMGFALYVGYMITSMFPLAAFYILHPQERLTQPVWTLGLIKAFLYGTSGYYLLFGLISPGLFLSTIAMVLHVQHDWRVFQGEKTIRLMRNFWVEKDPDIKKAGGILEELRAQTQAINHLVKGKWAPMPDDFFYDPYNEALQVYEDILKKLSQGKTIPKEDIVKIQTAFDHVTGTINALQTVPRTPMGKMGWPYYANSDQPTKDPYELKIRDHVGKGLIVYNQVLEQIDAYQRTFNELAPQALALVSKLNKKSDSSLRKTVTTPHQPIKFLLSDDPENAKKNIPEIQTLIDSLPGPVELIGDHGMGKDPNELLNVIQLERPTIVLVRSGTKAFKDKKFLALAYEYGVRAIVRAGAGYDNIDAKYAAQLGITVIRTNGDDNAGVQANTLEVFGDIAPDFIRKSWLEELIYLASWFVGKLPGRGPPQQAWEIVNNVPISPVKYRQPKRRDLSRSVEIILNIKQKTKGVQKTISHEFSGGVGIHRLFQRTLENIEKFFMDSHKEISDEAVQKLYSQLEYISNFLNVLGSLPPTAEEQLVWSRPNRDSDDWTKQNLSTYISTSGGIQEQTFDAATQYKRSLDELMPEFLGNVLRSHLSRRTSWNRLNVILSIFWLPLLVASFLVILKIFQGEDSAIDSQVLAALPPFFFTEKPENSNESNEFDEFAPPLPEHFGRGTKERDLINEAKRAYREPDSRLSLREIRNMIMLPKNKLVDPLLNIQETLELIEEARALDSFEEFVKKYLLSRDPIYPIHDPQFNREFGLDLEVLKDYFYGDEDALWLIDKMVVNSHQSAPSTLHDEFVEEITWDPVLHEARDRIQRTYYRLALNADKVSGLLERIADYYLLEETDSSFDLGEYIIDDLTPEFVREGLDLEYRDDFDSLIYAAGDFDDLESVAQEIKEPVLRAIQIEIDRWRKYLDLDDELEDVQELLRRRFGPVDGIHYFLKKHFRSGTNERRLLARMAGTINKTDPRRFVFGLRIEINNQPENRISFNQINRVFEQFLDEGHVPTGNTQLLERYYFTPGPVYKEDDPEGFHSVYGFTLAGLNDQFWGDGVALDLIDKMFLATRPDSGIFLRDELVSRIRGDASFLEARDRIKKVYRRLAKKAPRVSRFLFDIAKNFLANHTDVNFKLGDNKLGELTPERVKSDLLPADIRVFDRMVLISSHGSLSAVLQLAKDQAEDTLKAIRKEIDRWEPYFEIPEEFQKILTAIDSVLSDDQGGTSFSTSVTLLLIGLGLYFLLPAQAAGPGIVSLATYSFFVTLPPLKRPMPSSQELSDVVYDQIKQYIVNGKLSTNVVAGLINGREPTLGLSKLRVDGVGFGLVDLTQDERAQVFAGIQRRFIQEQITLDGELNDQQFQELAATLVGIGVDLGDMDLVVPLQRGEKGLEQMRRVVSRMGSNKTFYGLVHQDDLAEFESTQAILNRYFPHVRIEFKTHKDGFVGSYEAGQQLLIDSVSQVVDQNRLEFSNAWLAVPYGVQIDFDLIPGTALEKMRIGFITQLLGFITIPRGQIGVVGEVQNYLKTLIAA